MAKKSKRGRRRVNKSQAIRDYLAGHPNAMPKDIQAGLAAEGVKVSSALISAVKYGGKSAKGRRKAARGRAARTSITADELIHAKGLADRMGGVDRAKAVLEALAKLK